MRRRHLESVSAALYGSTFQHLLKSPIRIQPQLSGKGVLGHSPKCVLPTFAHTKVGPRRAGVQAVTLRRLRYADRRPQTIPCRVGIQILISKRPRPAARRLPTWSRISSAAHSSANRSPCRLAVPEKIFALLACSIFRPLRMLRLAASATGGARLRIPIHRAPLSRQDHITNPSSNSPTKSTIYAIFAQYFPIL